MLYRPLMVPSYTGMEDGAKRGEFIASSQAAQCALLVQHLCPVVLVVLVVCGKWGVKWVSVCFFWGGREVKKGCWKKGGRKSAKID